jgi:hypothetical protein
MPRAFSMQIADPVSSAVLRYGGPDTGVAWRLLAVGRSWGSYVRKIAEQAKCKSDAGTLYLRRLREWPGGLKARVSRHTRRAKRSRWHIDQLTENGDSSAHGFFRAGLLEMLHARFGQPCSGKQKRDLLLLREPSPLRARPGTS